MSGVQNFKARRWTAEEEEVIIRAVGAAQDGPVDWGMVSRRIKRTASAAYNHWVRLSNPSRAKPKKDAQPLKMVKCLAMLSSICQGRFPSADFGNRICPRCRGTQAWREGYDTRVNL